jgi:hypothetical protein
MLRATKTSTCASISAYLNPLVMHRMPRSSHHRSFGNGLRKGFCCVLSAAALAFSTLSSAHVQINDRWPIRGPKGPNLSPPHVEPTNQCSQSVYINSFIPKATLRVFRSGALIGGPFVTQFGFADVPVTGALHVGDSITATQQVNGVTSAQSAPMIVGKMPTTLPTPAVDSKIYACGRVVPVHNLVPGVKVEVTDLTTTSALGSGATPNLWGSDWDPVGTPSLAKGHQISATQSACTGVHSAPAPAVNVLPEPAPVNPPALDTPIVGNDAVTAHDLYTGAILKAYQPGVIGEGGATGDTNWMGVSPPIKPAPDVTADQTLCHHSPQSPPVTPTTHIPAPVLVGPICPGKGAAFVRESTIDATLVLLVNNVIVGYGGAAPGDVPLDLAPPNVFKQGNSVQVVEYIGSNVVFSNKVIVGCTNVVTYHNDNMRTGWNPSENTLTTANVRPATFGLVATVPMDDRIDTQPLVVTNQLIPGQGIHTVVYIETESNTIYAVDSWSGAILKSVSLGPPVPRPLGCMDSGPNVGINSTPTIDVKRRSMFVIAYTLVNGNPAYRLHELDLGTLQDKAGSPVSITASHNFSNGNSFSFHPESQRQRPALLEANGTIYAGFGSFCDWNADTSRGWLLGWSVGTHAALPANELTDTQPTDPDSFFLSSIWMSGYGLAAGTAGDLFFVTGNSDDKTYDGVTNIQESVVRLKSNLTSVLDLFTPSDVSGLDQGDTDYGSGGVMALPDQPGNMPHVAVAAGKEGNLFILNRDSMGGFHSPDIPKSVSAGACWCGPSFFNGSDGIGRVVTSGGTSAITWKFDPATSPVLQQDGIANGIPSVDGTGFFTAVSSNGTTSGSAIIWAVGRPSNGSTQIEAFAFDAAASGGNLTQIWKGNAGLWPANEPDSGSLAYLVPTVANGRLYVPGFKRLSIFGLRSLRGFPKRMEALDFPPPEHMKRTSPEGNLYWGTIRTVEGDRITLELRTGKTVSVDLSEAIKRQTAIKPIAGRKVVINGSIDENGVLKAQTLGRARTPTDADPDGPPQ